MVGTIQQKWLCLGAVLAMGLLSGNAQKRTVIKLHQLQFIGSHNSYKQALDPDLLRIILRRDSGAIGYDYHHISLPEQLDLGLRGLELDVVYDPAGRRFATPKGLELERQAGGHPAPYDEHHDLETTGFKVLHDPDIDFRSHCLRFVDCLREVLNWSERNQGHSPVIITINPKTSGMAEPGFARVLPFTERALDSLDNEIRSVLGRVKLITPDDVRDGEETLRDAVKKNGWPDVRRAAGKFLFVLDAEPDVTALYANPSGKGSPMFMNVPEDNPDAGFMILNEPVEDALKIRRLVLLGFMVRTRADANTMEARRHDLTRFQAAMNSGAQLISTDYYLSSLSPDKHFQIRFENGSYVHCNPVTAGMDCRDGR